ncbi:MAG: type II toxin-antitoxin system prevent-host-death family antitoxin [Oscillatoria sp. PMC 1068.18]|nr:type II toxin-antitoxin system prevent-host-death family antitoxin [Oscillatoria sp. PMC 1076.18]MEC4990561.1 type II toxin-antitoxin system prevent-host-death family antitoxin [Oscillatoria sp. PMC 1068.18]
MSKVSVDEAARNFKTLLNRVVAGEEVILIEQDKPVARLIPLATKADLLADLKDFRESLAVTGEPLSQTVIKVRQEERY